MKKIDIRDVDNGYIVCIKDRENSKKAHTSVFVELASMLEWLINVLPHHGDVQAQIQVSLPTPKVQNPPGEQVVVSG
jgi:hypothetical protein